MFTTLGKAHRDKSSHRVTMPMSDDAAFLPSITHRLSTVDG